MGRGVPGDTPFPGWQRPPEPRTDHLASAAGRLCLRALQLTRKRDRAEQGSLLPRLAADPGHDPDRSTELAALADYDSEVLAALTALGYSVVEAQSAIQSLPKDAPKEVEERLRTALGYFTG